jgi:hypothetical protein
VESLDFKGLRPKKFGILFSGNPLGGGRLSLFRRDRSRFAAFRMMRTPGKDATEKLKSPEISLKQKISCAARGGQGRNGQSRTEPTAPC